MDGQARDPGSRDAADEAAAPSIKALAQPHIERAINVLVDVMMNGERDGLRLAAACQLLDLAGGKTGWAEGSSVEDRNNEVDEILAEMRERVRRLRGTRQSPPLCGDRKGEVSA